MKTILMGFLALSLFFCSNLFAKGEECRILVVREKIAVLNRVDKSFKGAERLSLEYGVNSTIFKYIKNYRNYLAIRLLEYYDEEERLKKIGGKK